MVISVRGSDNQEREGGIYVNIERLKAVEWIDIVIFSIFSTTELSSGEDLTERRRKILNNHLRVISEEN